MRAAALILAGGLAAVACAPQGGLDVAELETQLHTQIRQQVAGEFPEVDAASLTLGVACPAEIDPNDDVAQVVECSATLADQTEAVQVTVGGPAGRDAVTAVVTQPMVSAVQVGQLVAEAFSSDLGVSTAVSCPYPVMFLPADATLRCTATDPSGVDRALAVSIGADGALDVALS